MRPDLLTPLFASAEGLKGVGPSLARPLDKLGLSRVKDFAYHLPDRFVHRRVDRVVLRGDTPTGP